MSLRPRDGVFDYVLARAWAPTGNEDNFSILVDNDGLVGVKTEENDVHTNYDPSDARRIARDLCEAADYCDLVNKGVKELGKTLYITFQGRESGFPKSRYEEEQEAEADNLNKAQPAKEGKDGT